MFSGLWTSRSCTYRIQSVPVCKVTVRLRTPYCWPRQCNETENWLLLTAASNGWFRKSNALTYVLFPCEAAASALNIHG